MLSELPRGHTARPRDFHSRLALPAAPQGSVCLCFSQWGMNSVALLLSHFPDSTHAPSRPLGNSHTPAPLAAAAAPGWGLRSHLLPSRSEACSSRRPRPQGALASQGRCTGWQGLAHPCSHSNSAATQLLLSVRGQLCLSLTTGGPSSGTRVPFLQILWWQRGGKWLGSQRA